MCIPGGTPEGGAMPIFFFFFFFFLAESVPLAPLSSR
jgi:hypothetical protein